MSFGKAKIIYRLSVLSGTYFAEIKKLKFEIKNLLVCLEVSCKRQHCNTDFVFIFSMYSQL